MINIIHLHKITPTIIHISPCYKNDQRNCDLLPSSEIINEDISDKMGSFMKKE